MCRFIFILWQLSMNIPLVEAVEKMNGYAKFMKDLFTKESMVSYETVDNLNHYSTIASCSLVQKKVDVGAFPIPCTIGEFNFSKAFCDLGANINLTLLVVFIQLGLGPQIVYYVVVDCGSKCEEVVGILCDVLLSGDVLFFVNFVVLDYEVVFDALIIFEIPFLATKIALTDIENGELMF